MIDTGEAATVDQASWWRRASGGREVVQVALPLVVSSLSWTVMTFIDRVLLFQLSGDAMAAAFSAGVVWFLVVCLPLGICTYTSTFISQYFGADQHQRIGPAMWQGVWSAVLFTPLALAAIPLAPAVFRLAQHEPAIVAMELTYFQIICLAAPAMWISQAFSSFYSGRGRTSVVMWIDTAGAAVNLVLDYFWIFGNGGFPQLGVAGAAWATVVAMWLKIFVYLVLVLQRRHRRRFSTWTGARLDVALFNRMFYFGGPSGVQMLLDVIGFTSFILIIGRLGPLASQATSMVFSVSTVAFMPVWGLSLAVTILVGQRLGEDRDDLAARVTWTSYAIALSYMALTSALFVFAPNLFLFGFVSGEMSAADQAAVRALAVVLLRFIAAYNFFDATFMIFVSAIKGAGDTAYVLRVSLVMAAALVSVSWLGVEVLRLGVLGCWTLITIWVWTLGLIFLRRFRQGKWRSMRVIEPAAPGLASVDQAAQPASDAASA